MRYLCIKYYLVRGPADYEPPSLTDEEWEKLLGEEPFNEAA
jgi:hypothetical protein